MGIYAGVEKTWASQTDVGRIHIATKGIVQSGLVLNLDAGASTSYPGSGDTWANISGTGGISTATGALPIYNTTDTGAFKSTGTRTDSNSSSLVLALPMDGANNGTTFTDESATIRGSGSAKTITRNGDSKTLTAVSKFYGSSGFFDGTDDYLLASTSADFQFGSGNFTIETWFYPNSNARMAIYHGSFGTDWSIGIDYSYITQTIAIWASSTGSSWNLADGDASGARGSIVVAVGQWHHIAMVRNGSNLDLYVNGVLDKRWAGISGSIVDRSSSQPSIGTWFGGQYDLNGYLQDLRVYKGVAKYTANFTPPIPKNGTLTNGATYSSANGGSIVFDGGDDYVQLASQNIRAVNFSVELWFYATSVSGNNVLYTSYNLPGGAQSQTFILELAGGKLYSSNGNGAGAFPSTTTVSNNTWYHVVATYTSSSSTQNLYVNGNLEVSGVGAINNEASSNFIGGSPGDNNIGSRWFGGRISAVRVYRTKALSAAEITQNFNALRSRYGI